MKSVCVVLAVLVMVCPICRVDAAEAGLPPWDMKVLSIAPKVYDDAPKVYDGQEHISADMKAIFYDGLPWKGKPTRVFAYYALPKIEEGKKVPAMILVHGGGGSAFTSWVKLWVNRGYAAIAMDTCGCISSGRFDKHQRHEHGGPPGWGGFDQIDDPIEDQWTYHAVADVILANSLIRSFSQVDPDRIGITGVSWGGYLTCIAAAVDNRFKFAAPVYGCGFLGENSMWLPDFKRMGPEKSRKWLQLWDPSVYLPRVNIPMLWVDGSNDFAYPMDSLQKSYRLPKAPRTLCVRLRMIHGHGGPGENPEEIHAMADAFLRGASPLAKLTGQGREGGGAWVTYETRSPIVKAELNYTKASGSWQNRKWETTLAVLDSKGAKASAVLPDGTTAYYFNLVDDRNLIVSSEHEE